MQHPEEGTIHAWLDGALPADEAAGVEAHVAACGECAAAVAEARGLIAGASRILTALDDVPGDVIPDRATAGPPAELVAVRDELAARRQAARAKARPRWLGSTALRAAAVVSVIALGTYAVSRRGPETAANKELATADSSAAQAAPVASPAAPAPPPAASNAPAAPAAPAPHAATQPADRLTTRQAPMIARGKARATERESARTDVAAKKTEAVREPSKDVAAERRVEADRSRDVALDSIRALAAPSPRAMGAAPAAAADVARGPTTGAIAGRVTAQTGAPVANAQVSIPNTPISARTNEQGTFTLNGVPAGAKEVQARALGFEPKAEEVKVASGETTSVALALKPSVARLEAVVTTGTAAVDERARKVNQPAAPPPASVANRVRATFAASAVAALAGCYEITPDPSASLALPRRIALDTAMATGAAGLRVRDLAAARPEAMRAWWVPLSTSALTLYWSDGARTSSAQLVASGDVLRGGAITARRVRCE